MCFGSTNCNFGTETTMQRFVFLHLLLRSCSLIRGNRSGMRGEAVLTGFVSQRLQLTLAVEFDMLKDGCAVINEKLSALLARRGLYPVASMHHSGLGEVNHVSF